MKTLAPFVILLAATPSLAQSTVLISADDQGHPAYSDHVFGISADGSFVLMSGGDWTASNSGLAVRDLSSGAVEILDAPTGSTTALGAISDAAWSTDRRFVVFTSTDDTLVAGDSNHALDAFLRDRQSGSIELISKTPAGISGNADTWSVRVSDDGRFVAFGSAASDLVAGDTNNQGDVFVRDRLLGTTTRVSLLANGNESQMGIGLADMTGDGRFVLLLGDSQLASGTPSVPFFHAVRRDMSTGATLLVDIAQNGAPGNAGSYEAHISSDGRFVSLWSDSSDLVINDSNQSSDTFLRDLQSATTTLVSHTSAGISANQGSDWNCNLSTDGRFVVFLSDSSNLVAGDTNQMSDVFRFDRTSGSVERVSVRSNGSQASASGLSISGPNMVRCSADGRFVAFVSPFDDLIPGGQLGSGSTRAFLRDRLSPVAPITAYCVAKVNSVGCRPLIGASGEPRTTGSDTFFVWAGDVRVGFVGILLWSLQPASTPFGGGTLCVASPIVRTPGEVAQNSSSGLANCTGEYAFQFSQAYFAQKGLVAGTSMRCQYFGRDNGFASPNNVMLSDALKFTVGP